MFGYARKIAFSMKHGNLYFLISNLTNFINKKRNQPNTLDVYYSGKTLRAQIIMIN